MRTLAFSATLACLACNGGTLGAPAPQLATAEACNSAEFRAAFLDGQRGDTIDGTRPSAALVDGGARYLPCLKAIASSGGTALGINGCAENDCRPWALWAIRLIGDKEARSFLVDYLSTDAAPNSLLVAIQGVGSLSEVAARPSLLKLLHHPNAGVRLRSIVALGAMKTSEDLPQMLEATKSLPESMRAAAVHGFRLMQEESALEALQRTADEMSNDASRSSFKRELDAWQSSIQAERQLLSTLQSGSGWDLIKAIQEVKPPVRSEIRSAVLSLLDNSDPQIRAESVVAIGKMQQSSDFDRLLAVTLALPEPYVPIAARGLETLNDERAIQPLQRYAADMKNDSRRQALLGIIERLRRAQKQTDSKPGATKAAAARQPGISRASVYRAIAS